MRPLGLNTPISPMWTPFGSAHNLGTFLGRWSAVGGAGLIGVGYGLDE